MLDLITQPILSASLLPLPKVFSMRLMIYLESSSWTSGTTRRSHLGGEEEVAEKVNQGVALVC